MADQAETLREFMKSQNLETGTAVLEVANDSEKKKGKTRIIAVASGKGGVGKTNISANLAITYAKLGKKVVILDADLGLANVNVILGIIPKFNLYHVMRKQKTMEEIVYETEYGIKMIAGASGFSKIANLNEEERQNFINSFHVFSDADILIIDTSAGVSDGVLSFLAAADDVIIVTTPEPTAITDAYGIIKVMSTEIDRTDLNIKLIVNRTQSVNEGKKVATRVINIAGQFLNQKIDYLGCVFDDIAVQNCVRKQKPFSIYEPKCKASMCLEHLVHRLENIEYKEGKGINNFLKKFINN
ncbi:MAG: MinD/ParA family protein [Spirochaetales bacterium]|nr:MinD/ParA family protein [Spirochaetales bacterium]